MKFCLSSRVKDELLKDADEVYIDNSVLGSWDDIPGLIKKYPDKRFSFVLDLSSTIIKMPKEIEAILNDDVADITCIIDCDKSAVSRFTDSWGDIDYFFWDSVDTYQDLSVVKSLGAKQAIIGTPLFFDLPTAVTHGIKFRCNPVATSHPYGDGIIGQWIRPEDLKAYEPYIETIFFGVGWADREKKLYEIYKVDREWRGVISSLIEGIDSNVMNSLIYNRDNQLVTARQTCRQKCLRDNSCKICPTAFILAEKIMKQEEKNFLKNS